NEKAFQQGIKQLLKEFPVFDENGERLVGGRDLTWRLRPTWVKRRKQISGSSSSHGMLAMLLGHASTVTTDVHYDNSPLAQQERYDRLESELEAVLRLMRNDWEVELIKIDSILENWEDEQAVREASRYQRRNTPLLPHILDAAEKEIEELLKETGGDLRQTQSTLIQKLALYPDGDFPVSEYSMYGDDSWVIFKGQDGEVIRINFDGMSEHGVSIKKSIVYHLIPEFAPFAGIRS
nr:hypothetical protein [Tanacetum cinerariifolium]